jgi:hypothetical protein
MNDEMGDGITDGRDWRNDWADDWRKNRSNKWLIDRHIWLFKGLLMELFIEWWNT